VNLPLALRLRAPVLLVADIDRGGVFASVVGTMALLEGEEKTLLRSFAINRLRGDLALFSGGARMIEERAGRPCLGVFPFATNIALDAEDSVSLDVSLCDARATAPNGDGLEIAIVRLPHMSNFTDFRLLPNAEYVTQPAAHPPDCIILPGSKNTIEDLLWLRRQGLDRWILEQHTAGSAVWGICGGYQMLGKTIRDPHGVESSTGEIEGLGLLPVETTLLSEKTTRAVTARASSGAATFGAYEIHMGETIPPAGDSPFAWIEGRREGFREGGVIGTYLHGALESPDLLGELLTDLARKRGKSAPSLPEVQPKDADYDRLADWFEQHADLGRFEELYLS
jgi:adenosylcobyric acid synthase